MIVIVQNSDTNEKMEPVLVDAWLCFQVGFQIKTRVQELGHGCIYMVQKAGALQLSPTDSFSKRELIECARAVTEKVSSMWTETGIFKSCRRKVFIYI